MTNFDKFCNSILEAYNFGATAYGNADIDKTTASEIQSGKIKPSWQYLGTRNNPLIAGFSVANNKLPAGTIVKITDRQGNPIGAQFGNAKGIYRVDDKGGKNVYDNIDFYSGSNKEMYNYFAGIGKDNLVVTPLNLGGDAPDVKQTIAQVGQYQGSGQPPEAGEQATSSPMMAQLQSYTAPLATDFSKGASLAALKGVLGSTVGEIEKTTGKKIPYFAGNAPALAKNDNQKADSDVDAFLGKGKWATTDKEEREIKDFLGEV